jgi:hypothetical protein
MLPGVLGNEWVGAAVIKLLEITARVVDIYYAGICTALPLPWRRRAI